MSAHATEPEARSADQRLIAITGASGFVGRALVRRLVGRGDTVRAVVRSRRSAEVVAALGATPVLAGLDDTTALVSAFSRADAVVHLAGETDQSKPAEVFWRTNAEGTRRVAAAAVTAAVPVMVHMSTEAVLADGRPLVDVDERTPIPAAHAGKYGASKAAAESAALAVSDRLRLVVLRPRLIWGPDDTNLLPQFAAAARDRRLVWFDGGTYATSTTHVDNVVQATILAVEKDQARGIYFVSDGEPIPFREFISALLETQGVATPDRTVPRTPIALAARAADWLWAHLPLPGQPPVTGEVLAIMGHRVTVDDSRIRSMLGYRPVVSRQDGLSALADIGAHLP